MMFEECFIFGGDGGEVGGEEACRGGGRWVGGRGRLGLGMACRRVFLRVVSKDH